MTARPTAQAAGRFQAARDAYEAGRSLDAYRILAALIPAEPRLADAHHLIAASPDRSTARVIERGRCFFEGQSRET